MTKLEKNKTKHKAPPLRRTKQTQKNRKEQTQKTNKTKQNKTKHNKKTPKMKPKKKNFWFQIQNEKKNNR